MITTEMVEQCESNPVRSRHHDWSTAEQAEYDSMHWRGRDLYDNLRTQFDVSHKDAFLYAVECYGTCPSLDLD